MGVFEIFKLGVGPSSSHTMGPMTAANRFVQRLRSEGGLGRAARVTVTLYGSLALTGRGHATDRAVILGLSGLKPACLDPDDGDRTVAVVAKVGRLVLDGDREIEFDPERDFIWKPRERQPEHPNALTLAALRDDGTVLMERTYYSIGGGAVRDEEEVTRNSAADDEIDLPFPFESAAGLLAIANAHNLTIAALMRQNELQSRSEAEIERGLDSLLAAMEACIDRGLRQDGCLPGGLKVRRRARQILDAISERSSQDANDPLAPMDFINLWALAVNEENAAGGRVVTAPTNGAAGIIPAVLRYYDRYHQGTPEGRRIFLLTAGAIGELYKRNASISGAEVGCQGEVGVACSMAAAGLCAVLGGTNEQIENAAEIGMEHNLGLTCDPIGGLVQIPCIERNAMGAIKAIDSARLALLGDGQHSVSLDKVIATMKRTGADMNEIYKETSLGGLAVNIVEC